MKQIHKIIPLPSDPYIQHYFTNTTAFFDIETTGFSPKYAFVYLIGLAVRQDSSIHIYQFLAKNRSEEARLLSAFHRCLPSGCTLITFNGIGFDTPFLKSREALYTIPGGWDSHLQTDLYKLTSKLSILLQLPDKKQKSVERFLGVEREDKMNGGELIAVYYEYEKKQDPTSEALLLLHNYEDVLGMTRLLPLLSYRDFFEQPPRILHAAAAPAPEHPAGKNLLLSLNAPVPFPKSCSCQRPPFCLTCRDTFAELSAAVLTGELKYYYENYRDYYYLPGEDMAVHKSVAAYVDPRRRKRAVASTCYTRRSGDFLPQKESWRTPCFYPGKKTKSSYFELTGEFLSDTNALKAYASRILPEFY